MGARQRRSSFVQFRQRNTQGARDARQEAGIGDFLPLDPIDGRLRGFCCGREIVLRQAGGLSQPSNIFADGSHAEHSTRARVELHDPFRGIDVTL